MDFEVCIDSVEGAALASKYGAKRVELCTALNDGGLTPSIGMIEACSKISTAEVFVMIRPKPGGFVYTEAELKLMERDIRYAHQAGAKGVVFGVLNTKNEIDIKRNVFLIEAALKLGLGTTFHRAIDVSHDPLKGLDDIINMGFDRVLTSGAQSKAIQGLALIQEMNDLADGRIEVMAGSGVNVQNALNFKEIGLKAIHFTARTPLLESLELDMGINYSVDEAKIKSISSKIRLV